MTSDPRADRAAMTAILADEIERWMRSDRIALMYGPEIMRGESVTREAAEDLAAILAQTLKDPSTDNSRCGDERAGRAATRPAEPHRDAREMIEVSSSAEIVDQLISEAVGDGRITINTGRRVLAEMQVGPYTYQRGRGWLLDQAVRQAVQLLHEGYGSDCPHSSDAEFIAAVQTLVDAGLFDEDAT